VTYLKLGVFLKLTIFSMKRLCHDYQADALRNAARRALYLYYGREHKWSSDGLQTANVEREKSFANL